MDRKAEKILAYPDTYNAILEYWAKIETGEEIVSAKVQKVYKKLAHDISEEADGYRYDARRGNKILEFAENFRNLIQGTTGPVRLELWEKAMLSAIFGFVDTEGNRKYREALLIVGKKNGKSLIASVVGLYLLLADGEPGPEVYAVATKRDQAKKIWDVGRSMVRKSPALSKRLKPLVGEILCPANDGTFKPLSSDANTLDGLNVHGVLMDEVHQWKNGRALYNIMADGVTARNQPLIFITTTAGTIREDIYDERYEYAAKVINGYFDETGYKDEHFIPFVYELDARSEWTDPSCWKKANPGLGTIKKYEQLAKKVEKAKANPMFVKNTVCKEFNIPETSSESWLTFEQIDNKEIFDIAALKPRYGIGGVDLSSTTDLTAAVVIFQIPGDERIYVIPMFWIPEDLVETRVREDKICYDLWIDQGFVRTTPGNRIKTKCVTQWFEEIKSEYDIYVSWVGYDKWMSADWVEDMENNANFGQGSMIPVSQTMAGLSTAMKALGADISAKKIIYNNNPVLKWCLTNTSYIEDKNANIKPCKTNSPTKRIDGFSALLDAYVVLTDNYAAYQSLI